MSSKSETPPDNDYTPWDDLTPARQRVAKTVAHVHGPQIFNRPDLRDDVKEADDVEDAIDDKERVLTSLKYTRLLNDLVEDGYLTLEHQGGNNTIMLDLEYEPERDTQNAAPYGDTSGLHTLVAQVCDREDITRDFLDEVDNPFDFNEVREKVNRAVGRTVLQPYSDPSEYRFTSETYSIVRSKVDGS